MATLMGLDCNLASNIFADYSNQQFTDAIKSLRPDICRTPGSEAQRYEWRKTTARPTIDSLLNLQDETGTNIIFVANMITKGWHSSLEMLRYARSIGVNVFGFEFANEVNMSARDVFPTALDYAMECNDWMKHIVPEFPDVKYLCVGENHGKEKWNEIVLEKNPDVFLVTHWHSNDYYVFNGVPNLDILRSNLESAHETYMPGIPPSKCFMTEWNLQEGQHELKRFPDFANSSQTELAAKTIIEKIIEMQYYGACYHNVVGFEDGAIMTSKWTGTYLQPSGNALKNRI